MSAKVIIDSRVNALYSSYYIYGLIEVFGKKNVSFSTSKFFFGEIDWFGETHSNDHYMPFVIIEGTNSKKMIIDFRDKTSIKQSAYDWCDHYAKININKDFIDEKVTSKLVSIPPGFGIKIWNPYQTFFYCLLNLYKSNFKIPVTFRRYFGLYWLQYKRPRLNEYIQTTQVKPNYVFFISSLWRYANTIKTTNIWRKAYIEFCFSNPTILFEGGFFSNPDNPQYNEYKKFVFHKRYSVPDYVKKSKKSCVVFNTPSVHNCHGWKLGEFLAMGKAIISTPLSNDLPTKIESIHFVSTVEELGIAIERILNDNEYRMSLEEASRKYYREYSSPASVIKRMVTG
ncbi:glycosyltransferase [Flavobacterium sp. RSB2_4_14]|uniref:glycosyltransferase n=1 Tax=Flavobacterium sp. RSB2_4_14 TaxID=3447665 RepID=UPI003F385804